MLVRNEYETGRRNRTRRRARGGGGGGGRIEGRYTERAKTRDALRVYVYVYVHVGVCACTYVYEYVCMGWIRCKEEGRRVRGRVVDIDRQAGRKGGRNRERERDVAKQRPSPISILIELNATSYLMPETRQKLQLNGDAISLYLPVHSS